MSVWLAQPSTPRSVRTLNQSVRRNSTSTLASRGTTWNTGYPRPGPVCNSRYGSVTNSCRYSRAALTAGAQIPARGRRPASAHCRARVINSVPYSIDRYHRVERIIEVLRADVQPLGHEAQLIRRHEAGVSHWCHATGARGDAGEELRRERAIRGARIHVRTGGHGHARNRDAVREQQLLIRDGFLRHGLR